MIEYDPFSHEVREDPYPFYAKLREQDPAHYMEKYDAWVLSRFQDIWDASNDPETYSVARGSAPAQLLTRDQPVDPMLNTMDPPAHTTLRSAVRRQFLPGQVKKLVPIAEQICSRIVDRALETGRLDIVEDYAGELSVRIACLAIGLPMEDGPWLSRLVKRFFEHDPETGGMTRRGLDALQSLRDYCRDAVAERRRSPGDGGDALDVLASIEVEGRRFTADEAASHVAMLVIGGSETLPKVVANGVRRLAEYPDQRAMLVADPSMITDAFDEILRYDMPTQLLGRTLRRDVTLHDRRLTAGQAVFFLFASANRDRREFDRPDVFDVTRRPSRILSFGAGTHQCLGTHVARMEGRVALDTLLQRVPHFEVDLEGAERLKTEFVQGFAKLPIVFEPS